MGEYYKAKEAIEILKLPPTTFYRKVKNGDIPHKGKRPNMRFPKEAIDAIAEYSGANKEENPNLTFTLSTIADAWEKQEITQQPYGENDAVPFKTVLAWRQKNDEISMNVKRRNKVLGWTTFLPLEEEVIHELIEDKLREKDIPIQAIKKWNEPRLSVYIPIIEVVPSKDPNEDKEVAAYLIKKTVKWAITLMIQHDIKNWYSIGTTPEGQSLLEAVGFKQLNSLENGERKGYILETKAEPVRLITRFLNQVGATKSLAEKAIGRGGNNSNLTPVRKA